jgi:hypothetical protein
VEHAGALEVGHGDGEVTFVIVIAPNIPADVQATPTCLVASL